MWALAEELIVHWRVNLINPLSEFIDIEHVRGKPLQSHLELRFVRVSFKKDEPERKSMHIALSKYHAVPGNLLIISVIIDAKKRSEVVTPLKGEAHADLTVQRAGEKTLPLVLVRSASGVLASVYHPVLRGIHDSQVEGRDGQDFLQCFEVSIRDRKFVLFQTLLANPDKPLALRVSVSRTYDQF